MQNETGGPEVLAQVEPDGRFLRHHREAAGLSLSEVARRAGYSHGYLSLIESGDKRLPAATLARIANAIAGVTYDPQDGAA